MLMVNTLVCGTKIISSSLILTPKFHPLRLYGINLKLIMV
nr:MAG TPA: hypothetical protein [Crassvirales sp.]